MATYTSDTITTTRHRFRVPAPGPWGATYEEIGKAANAAERAYREVNKLDPAEAIPGNALSWFPGDDEIVISFVVEQPPA